MTIAEPINRAGARPARRPAPPPPRPPLRVVPVDGARRRSRAAGLRLRRRLVVVGVGVLLALGLLALVGVHVEMTSGQFQLHTLDQQATQREAEYQRLRLQVAELEAPQRIVDDAARLGMQQPPKVTYLAPDASTVAAGAATSVPAPPTPSTATKGAEAWGTVKRHLDAVRP